jgi:hypothetical protein
MNTLVEPVVRQEATKKSLLAQRADLDNQLQICKHTLDEEADGVVTLAEQLENLGIEEIKVQQELQDHEYITDQIAQRKSDMVAALEAMDSQIHLKEAEIAETEKVDKLKLAQVSANYEKNVSQYFAIMRDWSDDRKNMLKLLLLEEREKGEGEGSARAVEMLLAEQLERLKEEFGDGL